MMKNPESADLLWLSLRHVYASWGGRANAKLQPHVPTNQDRLRAYRYAMPVEIGNNHPWKFKA